jgi:hypothetical protein
VKLRLLTISLLILSPHAFSQPESSPQTMLFSKTPIAENTITYHWSNESEHEKQSKLFGRSVEFPTQIVRVENNVASQKITCEFVKEEIEKAFSGHLASNKFTYNTYVYCGYNPKTDLATMFSIHSYFDPINDTAVEYLKAYLEKYNDSDLLGTKLHIESAKGLIISMLISAGIKEENDYSQFIEYRRDRSNFYFKSNYEMRDELFTDIYKNFFSHNPKKVLPFLNRWIYDYAGKVYHNILIKSNYVALEPERIFLMDQGETIFVSNFRYYFGHICEQYKNHRCL